VHGWEHQCSRISSRTRLLLHDRLQFPRECDGTRGEAHRLQKKSLSYLALESLWWSEHCKSDQARHAFSLPLDCCDCLDWNQISTEKTYHNRTRHLSLKRVKSSFSWITSCVQLSWCIQFTLMCARKKVWHKAHLISSDTIQYRAVSITIASGVHSVTTFVSVVVVVMSCFDLCWTQLILFLCIR
jgi:uncharacterized membrane protein (DUF485 family)